MSYKKWIVLFLLFSTSILSIIGGINYFVDPYGVYDTKIFDTSKIKQDRKIRFVKAIRVYQIKPASIILGTSRAAFGFDPNHSYFLKPSYNMAVNGSTMYENRINFEWALKQGHLKQVLLVADYGMFTFPNHKSVPEFEKYSQYSYIYGYLFSLNTLKDSYETVFAGSKNNIPIYFANGQRSGDDRQKLLTERGGHLSVTNLGESTYYKIFSNNYIYSDTGKSSLADFKRIVDLCYKNNIKLDIIFGPSHIRQWEALNYYIGYSHWLQWKKDIVLTVNRISNHYHKPPYRVFDFSVYHPLTAEEVPKDPSKKMKYHWECGHYKNALGLIVLDKLNGTSSYNDFGTEITMGNIDQHLKKQLIDRRRYIDVKQYKKNLKHFLENHPE